jgi:hypothetical protein
MVSCPVAPNLSIREPAVHRGAQDIASRRNLDLNMPVVSRDAIVIPAFGERWVRLRNMGFN